MPHAQRSLQVAWFAWAVALSCVVVGCSCTSDDQKALTYRPPTKTAEGEAPKRDVEVLSDTGDFWIVRMDDGHEVQIDNRLMRENADGKVQLFASLQSANEETGPGPSVAMVVERASLAAVFISEKSGKKVIAAASRKPVIDGEVYWRAITCLNPACPGEGDGPYPYLFINPRPGNDTFCPACKAIRDPATETTEQRNQYRYWARAYVLPEAAERQKQLDAEHRRRLQEARERRKK